ncbi:MAG TPA: adenylate/guanylate cyclase domain-containing protein [Conexivisphaerales archaeon]|nr:adenylate/guanylate cyclase domain-containing protein [Conexivisphaerales archaeon]
MSEGQRRLAAIMFTDMVGYTALGQRDEALSLALVEEQRNLIRPILKRHDGREVKTMGDAFLVEFPNAIDSVRCAYDIQRAIREFNLSLASDKRIHLRVGIHLGEVVESQGDISGDAVNVASRIEPLAEDGGVCLSRQVYDQVANKTELQIASLGERRLKNVSAPLEVYRMVMPWEQPPQVSREGTDLPRDRVAILPLRNMSPDPNDEFFAEGMTEEIISTVSGISGLKVISRTSVMGYKGTTKRIGEIGRELKAGSVLEGSFRKAGNRIRVTAQLIDVAGDEHLWAQSYDRNLDDVFEVQSDIARQVADALRVKILLPEMQRIERKPTENTKAYTLYLKGRYLWSRRGFDDLKKASDLFEEATKEDPAFALGYVGQADCAALLRNNWNLDPEVNLTKAKAMVAKALDLDPSLAEAHTTKGFLLRSEYKLREAEEEYRKAIELKPSYATAHQWYYWVLRSELRWDEAQREIEKAVELDPLSPVINLNHGNLYFSKREFAKSLEQYRRALELGFESAHGDMAGAYGMMKEFGEMRREMEAGVAYLQNMYPSMRTAAEAYSAYFEGDKHRVRELLPEVEAHLGQTPLAHCNIADFHFYLGEVDKGFEWLEKSYSIREESLLDIKWDWDLDGVRNDPRYLDLLKRLGLD